MLKSVYDAMFGGEEGGGGQGQGDGNESTGRSFVVHHGLETKPDSCALKNMPAQTRIRRFVLDPDAQKMVRFACSHDDEGDRLLESTLGVGNPLVAATVLAFDHHLPLRLRPQHFWLAISQALAMHVEGNPDELRSRFVAFAEGKKKLKLDVTAEAARGFHREDWEGVAASFENLIRDNTMPGVVEAIGIADGEFSSTKLAERVASSMTVMDACKSYFDYKMCTCCGFPRITLDGTEGDWIRLRAKAEATVRQLALPGFADRWLPALLSVLDKLVEARRDASAVDVEFWESMAKRGGTRGSGARTWVSGWINVFFPLMTPKKSNPFCEPFRGGDQYLRYRKDHWGNRVPEQKGLEIDDFPSGLCSAPVTLDGQALEFRAGFVGVAQDRLNGGEVTPSVGWVAAAGVVDRTKRHFGERVIDPKEATALFTTIGVEIPLLPFTGRQPFSLRDVE